MISFNDPKKKDDPAVHTVHTLVSVDEEGFMVYFVKGKRTYNSLGEVTGECRKLVRLADGGGEKVEAFRRIVSVYASSWQGYNAYGSSTGASAGGSSAGR